MRKSWPQIVILAAILLIALGLIFGGGVATIVYPIGLAVFLIGCVAATVRFAMRRRLIPHFLCGLVLLVLLGFSLHKYYFSLAYIRGADERPTALWMTALKGLGYTGPVYYVGNEGEFSYFRAGEIFPDRFKALTAKIRLPRTFPLGAEKPYRVTQDMVYYRD